MQPRDLVAYLYLAVAWGLSFLVLLGLSLMKRRLGRVMP